MQSIDLRRGRINKYIFSKYALRSVLQTCSYRTSCWVREKDPPLSSHHPPLMKILLLLWVPHWSDPNLGSNLFVCFIKLFYSLHINTQSFPPEDYNHFHDTWRNYENYWIRTCSLKPPPHRVCHIINTEWMDAWNSSSMSLQGRYILLASSVSPNNT